MRTVLLVLPLLFLLRPVHAVNRLFIPDRTVMVGDTNVSVPVRLDNDQNLYGFSLSISTDVTRLTLEGLDLTGTVVAGAEYSSGQTLASGARITWGVVLDISDPFDVNRVVPVGADLHIANLRFDVAATQAGQASLNFQDYPPNYQAVPPDPGAKNKLLRENGVGVSFTTTPGMITIEEESTGGVGPFLRGDCNNDGAVSGVVTDAVFMLNFNFTGGNRPVCFAACDVNADGQFSGAVTDAVYLLNFNFLGGPAPLAPYPTCGSSDRPTDVTLGCITPTCQ
jgi:hypothetical protein